MGWIKGIQTRLRCGPARGRFDGTLFEVHICTAHIFNHVQQQQRLILRACKSPLATTGCVCVPLFAKKRCVGDCYARRRQTDHYDVSALATQNLVFVTLIEICQACRHPPVPDLSYPQMSSCLQQTTNGMIFISSRGERKQSRNNTKPQPTNPRLFSPLSASTLVNVDACCLFLHRFDHCWCFGAFFFFWHR